MEQFYEMGVNMFEHYSVLKNDAIKGLNINPHGTYVDCTVGGGGHSEHIVRELDDGMLVACEHDRVAVKAAQEQVKQYKIDMTFNHSNIKNIEEKLIENVILNVEGNLLVLGVSSPMLDRRAIRFSFH